MQQDSLATNDRVSPSDVSRSDAALGEEVSQRRVDHAHTASEQLHFEDLNEGDRWESGFRQITADDVCQFSELTGDFDPLHQNKSSLADESPFGRPVVHGMLGLSVMAGLGTEYPRAATLALVGITDWEFTSPIYFGQKVKAVNEIESLEPHGRRAGRVVWRRKLLGEDGRILQQGRLITLVAARERLVRTPK